MRTSRSGGRGTSARGRLKEILSVFKDGVYDAWYSDNWPQQVEELVPLEISQLFFFDAEKIRTLTEDETSSQALGAAIKSLLGLDIVERLIADAAVIQARQAKEGATAGHREKVEVLESQAEELGERIKRLNEERTSLENHVQRADAAQKTAEMKFIASGGRYWELRQVREGKKKELETRAGEIEAQLLKLAAGELPLAMVPELLEARGAPGLAGAALEPGGDRGGAAGRARRGAARDAAPGEGQRAGDRAGAGVSGERPPGAAGGDGERAPAESLAAGPRAAPPPEQPPARGAAAGGRACCSRGTRRLRQELDDLERGIEAAPKDEEIGQVVEAFKAATARHSRSGERGRSTSMRRSLR